MNPMILEAMKVQGQLRIKFMQYGISEELALELAANAIDALLKSKLASE